MSSPAQREHYSVGLNRVLRPLVGTLVFLLARWRVTGVENIPHGGACIVVCNHLHNADPPLLAYALGKPIAFMAKQELFRFAPAGYFLRRLGAFPVERGQWQAAAAVSRAQEVLADGCTLAVFPEGRRSPTGRLQKGYPGAALLAYLSGAPILPVSICGTERLKGWGWLRRPRIKVAIGVPFRLPPSNGKLSREELELLTGNIMRHIAGLLPEEYR